MYLCGSGGEGGTLAVCEVVVRQGSEGRVLATENLIQVAGLKVHACEGLEDQRHPSPQLIIAWSSYQRSLIEGTRWVSGLYDRVGFI